MKEFFNQKVTPKITVEIVSLALVVGFLAYSLYSYNKMVRSLSGKLNEVSNELVDTKSAYDNRIADLEQSNTNLKTRTEIIQNILLSQQQTATSVSDKVSQITGAVDDLKKLSQTDPELLKKYSKVYFLNEHYVPLSLTTISSQYSYASSKPLQIHSSVYPYFVKMLDDAGLSGMSLRADSAYRSFSDQAVLKSNYRFVYGAGTANQFSADQGYSEHQLGTAVDFTTDNTHGGLTGFDKQIEYTWMKNNAYRYGFILSYPPNNSYYVFEPWHWRFVGVALATKLHQDNMNFYDMDQRVIDTYLVHIFD
jgi:LAS superfamily LD-carboxypeptidase LdcB